jgi:hypothetical protein
MFKCPSCHQPAFTARQILLEAAWMRPITCPHCGVPSDQPPDGQRNWIVSAPILFIAMPILSMSRPEWWPWQWVALALCSVLSVVLILYIPLAPLERRPEAPEAPQDPFTNDWPHTLWW